MFTFILAHNKIQLLVLVEYLYLPEKRYEQLRYMLYMYAHAGMYQLPVTKF